MKTRIIPALALAFSSLFAGSLAHANRCSVTINGKPADHQATFYQENPYYNGAFLLQFFGPMQNSFTGWLKALESDDLKSPLPAGPGFYHGSNKLVLAKHMEYPLDAGLDMQEPGRRRIVELLEFHSEEVLTFRGSSPAAVKAREQLLQKLDLQLFGLYGAIGKETHDALKMRLGIGSDPLITASMRPRVKVQSRARWMYEDANPPKTTPLDDLKRVVQIVEHDEHTIMVKVDLSRKPQTKNEEILQRMFFLTHWQMAQKNYRESKLMPDDFKSALYMLDDLNQSMAELQSQQSIFLLYDIQAWHSMVYRINEAQRYVSTYMTGAGWQPFQYKRISDAFSPFYPTYGTIVEKYADNGFEIKRLFHNANPDPLNALDPTDYKIPKFKFYQTLAKQMPAGAEIKAISKSKIHTRLYKGIGFRLESSVFEPERGTNKDTLLMTAEEFLANTSK